MIYYYQKKDGKHNINDMCGSKPIALMEKLPLRNSIIFHSSKIKKLLEAGIIAPTKKSKTVKPIK
jgi:hypothetical protein